MEIPIGETIINRTRSMSNQKITNPYSLFVLLRHGESTGNAEKRHQGQADFPLTEQGILQAEQLASAWSKKKRSFDLVISSPQSRAKQTAEILKKSLNLKIEYDPIWMERDNGKLAGLLHDEAKKSHPQPDFIPLFQPIASTGESQWDLYLRAGDALKKLVSYPPGEYLVISHGGFLNMVMHALVGLSPRSNFQGPVFRFSNTGYTTVQYRPGNDNWIIFGHNDLSHLAE